MPKKSSNLPHVPMADKSVSRDAALMASPPTGHSLTSLYRAVRMLLVARGWSDRAVVALHVYQDKSIATVADAIGSTPGKVKDIVRSLQARVDAAEQRHKIETTVQRMGITSKTTRPRKPKPRRIFSDTVNSPAEASDEG